MFAREKTRGRRRYERLLGLEASRHASGCGVVGSSASLDLELTIIVDATVLSSGQHHEARGRMTG